MRPAIVALAVVTVVAVVHVAPASDETSTTYPVTAEPPFATGADQMSETVASPAITTGAPGRPGVVAGVAATGVLDAPTPAVVIALTRTSAARPLVSPVSTVAVAGPFVSDAMDHDCPESVEISTR